MSLRAWVLPVPGESRVAVLVTGAVALCLGVLVVTVAVAWDAPAARATSALTLGIAALTGTCAVLAAYIIWLRARVQQRMTVVLAPYLDAQPNAATSAAPVRRSRSEGAPLVAVGEP